MNEKDLKDEYAEINGNRLHYVSCGEGPLLVFLHGFPEFWFQWKEQLLNFGESYHAVAPDMRGYNLSAKPTKLEDYKLPHLVEDVKLLCEHFKQKRMILVAHDWGGVVAWSFALKYPQYLERLVILNSPHPAIFARELKNNPEQQKASEYIKLLVSPEAETVLSQNNFNWLTEVTLGHSLRKGLMSVEDAEAYAEAWRQPGALTGMVNYYRANLADPTAESYASSVVPKGSDYKIKVPTLVIWGEADKALLSGNLVGLEDYVEHLELKKIPDTSHWVVQEQPDLVHRYITDFITLH